MYEVTNWTFGETEVRTIERDGEPWWVLSDVCKVMDLSNPTVVANRLEEDERSKLDLGRQGTATIINESGLYSVIIRSDKPQAKRSGNGSRPKSCQQSAKQGVTRSRMLIL